MAAAKVEARIGFDMRVKALIYEGESERAAIVVARKHMTDNITSGHTSVYVDGRCVATYIRKKGKIVKVAM